MLAGGLLRCARNDDSADEFGLSATTPYPAPLASHRRQQRAQPFAVFAGADSQIPEVLRLGAVGCIGGLANVVPEAMVRVYHAAVAGNPESSANDLELLREINLRMHLVPFPINIAAAMEARGLNPGTLPATLSRVTRAHYEQLKREVGELLAAHGVPRC